MKRFYPYMEFSVLALVIFIKVVLFQYFVYHSLLISSIVHDPVAFFQFWLPKIAVSVLIACFVFVIKNKWWQIPMLLLIDTWIIANILYFRANNLVLSYDAIMMAGNVSTVTESVWMYFNYTSWIFVLITLIYTIILFFLPKYEKRNYAAWGTSLAISVVLTFINNYSYMKQELVLYQDFRTPKLGLLLPIYQDSYEAYFRTIDKYIKNHTIITYFPVALQKPYTQRESVTRGDIKAIDDEKRREICTELQQSLTTVYFADKACMKKPQRNILFILVESLESWTIGAQDVKGNYYLPHLSKMVGDGVSFYADKVQSQVRDGVSGDGQTIVSTGLLPLQHGSANMIYYDNVYPSYAHLYDNSLLINSDNIFWRSNYVFQSYGYKDIISPTDTTQASFFDVQTFNIAKDKIPIMQQPSLSMVLTIDSHSPFLRVQRKPEQIGIEFPSDMPNIMQNYLTSLNHVDSCINDFLTSLDKNYLENTDVVISGDHTIFKEMMLREFKSFAKKHDYPIKNGKNYVPLIIISPDVTEHIYYDRECYQMDIYPTLMSLIGAYDCYSWKGFGINLLDEDNIERQYTQEEAYRLSDEMIRNNFFAR